MKIAILGAGSIGCYLGGALIAAGGDVVLIGHSRMAEIIRCHGLRLTDLHGRDISLPTNSISYLQDPSALAQADLILVTVKRGDTEEAAKIIATHAAATALVISFQNGIGNTETLRSILPGWRIIAGMVPFNVVQMPEGRFHRGTEGALALETAPELFPWKTLFQSAGLSLHEHNNFISVQWGKLILNLNNPINALSGLPLKLELSQRSYRRCLAALIEETNFVLKVAQIQPTKITKINPRWLPKLLRLPNFIFVRIAASMLQIDPEARSSMWDDLHAKRRTEVDYLNGAVVTLAQSLGLDAPLNRRIVALIRRAEEGNVTTLSGDKLMSALNNFHL